MKKWLMSFLAVLICGVAILPCTSQAAMMYFNISGSYGPDPRHMESEEWKIADITGTIGFDSDPTTYELIGTSWDIEYTITYTDITINRTDGTSITQTGANGHFGSTAMDAIYDLEIDSILFSFYNCDVDLVDPDGIYLDQKGLEYWDDYTQSGYHMWLNFEAIDPPPVPEPATILLLWTGLLGIAGVTRRKSKRIE